MVANSLQTFSSRLERLYNRDRNAKAIFLATNSSELEGQLFLETSWHIYGMMNIIFCNLEENLRLKLSILDPFLPLQGSTIRGQTFTFELANNHKIVEDILLSLKTRLWDVHKYPLKICIFINPGTAAPDVYVNGTIKKFKLQDGEIINALAKASNFDPVYVFPKDGVPYGHKKPNGSITGKMN